MCSRAGMFTGLVTALPLLVACECVRHNGSTDVDRPRDETRRERMLPAHDVSPLIAEEIKEIIALRDRMKEQMRHSPVASRREVGLPTDEEVDEMTRKAMWEVFGAAFFARAEMADNLRKIQIILTTHTWPSERSE